MLSLKGFSRKWIEWIMSFISSRSVAVNVNDEVGPYFQTKKGLRQGDPLSHILFNLVADISNFFLEHAGELHINILRRKGKRSPKCYRNDGPATHPKTSFKRLLQKKIVMTRNTRPEASKWLELLGRGDEILLEPRQKTIAAFLL